MLLDGKGFILTCEQCHQRNRLRFELLNQRQQCGSCQCELPLLGEPVEILDQQSLPHLIGQASIPVLVDFWASWCGPCLMMASEIEKVAQELTGKIAVVKVNADDASDLAAAHRVRSLPTLSLHWQGKEVARIMGARPAQAIQQWLEPWLPKAGANNE